MSVNKNIKKLKDAKSFKKKLIEKTEVKDYKRIPFIVQEDINT
jgi:hypothetical protein